MDTAQRTILKAVLWNLLGLLMTGLVALALSGSLVFGGMMALLNTALGLICYITYERIWSRVNWGRNV